MVFETYYVYYYNSNLGKTAALMNLNFCTADANMENIVRQIQASLRWLIIHKKKTYTTLISQHHSNYETYVYLPRPVDDEHVLRNTS